MARDGDPRRQWMCQQETQHCISARSFARKASSGDFRNAATLARGRLQASAWAKAKLPRAVASVHEEGLAKVLDRRELSVVMTCRFAALCQALARLDGASFRPQAGIGFASKLRPMNMMALPYRTSYGDAFRHHPSLRNADLYEVPELPRRGQLGVIL